MHLPEHCKLSAWKHCGRATLKTSPCWRTLAAEWRMSARAATRHSGIRRRSKPPPAIKLRSTNGFESPWQRKRLTREARLTSYRGLREWRLYLRDMQNGTEEAQMRIWLRGAIFASAAAVLMTAFQQGAVPPASGVEALKAPRTADGKADLNGIWQALNTANWDIQEHAARAGVVVALGAAGAVPGGLGVVEGDQIPYLPEAAAKKKANFENRLTIDPEIKCYLPGVPRATYMPYPFQIVQTS